MTKTTSDCRRERQRKLKEAGGRVLSEVELQPDAAKALAVLTANGMSVVEAINNAVLLRAVRS